MMAGTRLVPVPARSEMVSGRSNSLPRPTCWRCNSMTGLCSWDRWKGLLLELLTDYAVCGHPDREELRRLVVESWTGRVSIDSVGFRMVRAFRTFAFEEVYGWLTDGCAAADERLNIYRLRQWKGLCGSW